MCSSRLARSSKPASQRWHGWRGMTTASIGQTRNTSVSRVRCSAWFSLNLRNGLSSSAHLSSREPVILEDPLPPKALDCLARLSRARPARLSFSPCLPRCCLRPARASQFPAVSMGPWTSIQRQSIAWCWVRLILVLIKRGSCQWNMSFPNLDLTLFHEMVNLKIPWPETSRRSSSACALLFLTCTGQ